MHMLPFEARTYFISSDSEGRGPHESTRMNCDEFTEVESGTRREGANDHTESPFWLGGGTPKSIESCNYSRFHCQMACSPDSRRTCSETSQIHPGPCTIEIFRAKCTSSV